MLEFLCSARVSELMYLMKAGLVGDVDVAAVAVVVAVVIVVILMVVVVTTAAVAVILALPLLHRTK